MNSSESNPAEIQRSEVTPATLLSVGKTLRAARENAGLSVIDISNRIKFGQRQIEALEADNFSNLPEPTFVRGFVRSYARLLQIDEQQLLDALPQDKKHTSGDPLIAVQVNVPFPTQKSAARVNIIWLSAALCIALLMALFVWLYDSSGIIKKPAVATEPLSIQTPDQAISAVAVTDNPVLVAAPENNRADISGQQVEPEKNNENIELEKKNVSSKSAEPRKIPPPKEPISITQTQAQVDINSVTAPVQSATDKPSIPLEQLKRRPMHFVFNDDTWVEVKDVNGVILLSRINRRGNDQWVGGPHRAPYAVSISNPGHVRLYYLGNEIDLSAYAAEAVAHLKVQ